MTIAELNALPLGTLVTVCGVMSVTRWGKDSFQINFEGPFTAAETFARIEREREMYGTFQNSWSK